MVRYTRDEGHIHIAWGHDEFLGYFFSLYDKRLRSKGDASSEVKMICSHVSEDDSGAYLNLTTGLGIGKKVSRSTMFTFMMRYGIEPMTIETEPENFHPESLQPETIEPKTIIKTAGGETPEMRIDPKYIEARKQRLRDQIILTAESGGRATVVVGRLDRTIQELSQDYNIPITQGLFPSEEQTETTFFFCQGFLRDDFKQCYHPDCCLPERGTENYQRCSKCKQAVYCSRTCQVADWKSHKSSCQPREP